MIYLSFDIGIKNLAMCILKEYNDEVSILDWRIITLSEKKNIKGGVTELSDILYIELDNIIKYIDELYLFN